MKSVRKPILRLAAIVLPLPIVWFSASQGVAKAQTHIPPAQQAAPTAAQRFKNLQVLGDIPASELLRTMHFIRASLGVRCDHCHVTDGQRYELDDRPAKAKAREMIRMVRRINAEQFDERRV